MPEFILDHGTREATEQFRQLDEFTQAYVTAMFWTDCNTDNGELEDATLAELAPDAWQTIIETCREFQESHAELLGAAYCLTFGRRKATYCPKQAGHDFWLTRNGHGTGFWDRGLGDIGKRLSEMSRPYGESSPYRGDNGQIYVYGD